MIKAIETVYNGCRFRSRLEARWAVFFDAMDLVWEYEKEGFDLGEYGWYLPDFWLPNQKLWIEIKPNTYENLTDLWVEHPVFNAWHFEDDEDMLPGGRFAVIVGNPWPKSIEKHLYYYVEEMEYVICLPYDTRYFWCECPLCGTVNIQYEARFARNCKCTQDDSGSTVVTPKLIKAYTVARQARFEHGENGISV
jgi:hypothetical protein